MSYSYTNSVIPSKSRRYALPWELKNGQYIRRLFAGETELTPIILTFDSFRCSWTSRPESAYYVGMCTSLEGAKSTAERRLKKMGFLFISKRLVCML